MKILSSRRLFIKGLISLVAAPAIVRAESLMPVKAIPMLLPGEVNFENYCVHQQIGLGYAITRKAIEDNQEFIQGLRSLAVAMGRAL